MQEETLGDMVSVRADFSGGKITPRAFRRGGRTHRVTAVNARWQDREGAHPAYCFSVQIDGDTTCFLRFDTASAVWRIEQVLLPG